MKPREAIYLVGAPEEYKSAVKNTAECALASVRKELRSEEPITVVVFEAQTDLVIPEIGLTGRAIGKEGIEVFIDFERTYPEGELEAELSATIYHEAAHLVREHALGYNKTFLDAVVSEGVSIHVEKHFQPERSIPYITPLKDEQILLKKAEDLFHAEDFDFGKWFFGNGEFPKWVGYRLGYMIVEAYVSAVGPSVDALVRTPSVDIWKKSGMETETM